MQFSHLFFALILSISTILVYKVVDNLDFLGKDSRPNIIYIMADDLGYGELGVYGQEKIETPNIDALAEEGMLFKQFYSGAPVCAPARAVFLTGMHMGHVPIRGNDEWVSRGNVWDFRAASRDSSLEGQKPLPANTITIAQTLKNQGYITGLIGKWGLGAPHSQSIPTKMGFDYFFGYNCQRQAHTYNPLHLYENEIKYHLDNDTVAPGTGIPFGLDSLSEESYAQYDQNDYSEKVSFEKLMGFVKKNKSEPFFLYWASPIPHLPLQAPKKWVNYYKSKFGKEDPYVFYKNQKKPYFPVRYPHATYAGMVSYLDENVGKLIAYLKEEKLYDNTLIIFTSDNGPTYTGGADSPWFKSGGPFPSNYGRGKGFLHEGGIRVPFIATWPKKIKPGTESAHIGAFWDLFPTLCEAANVGKHKETDGLSFYPTLIGDGVNQKAHPYLYWEFPEYGGQVAVRIGQYKVIWKDLKKGNTSIQVYNLDIDIAEKIDISEEHPELIKKFYEIICEAHKTPDTERFYMEAIESICQ